MVHWGDPYGESSGSPASQPRCITPTQEPPYTSPLPAPRALSTAFSSIPSSTYDPRPDVELVSSDNVHFSVRSDVLRRASFNDFAGALQSIPRRISSELPRLHVPDTAGVLNILLHASYGTSPIPFTPSCSTLVEVVRRMPTYGLDPQAYVGYGSVLFECIRPYAAVAPMEVYALAAAHDLLALAQVASTYLLSYPLQCITEAQARLIGAAYLERLVRLHRTRLATLHELLRCPPEFHAETAGCSFAAQEDMTRAWDGAVEYVMKHARPDIVANTLQQKLEKLKEGMICQECKKVVERRIRDAVVNWTMAPGSI
uniref:BTB domain-containing protein n=2 Tax=Schizophyllum commune (strain H4-8 / FGSC 9210) TaxID=578458 RepID=D8Q5P7_SCHCM